VTIPARKPRLRQPPFAAAVLSAKARRQRLNVFIHAGDHAWRRAKARPQPHVLCCPPEEEFTAFDWSCVKGMEIALVVWNRAPGYVDAFAAHLVKSGATLVTAITGGEAAHPLLTIYKPRAR